MKFYIVDVFAEEKYQGNQLAVFIPDREITTAEMQQMAREINFSETTFILSDKQENGGYQVRIFTPAIEVPFAGHPTLGTVFVIHQVIENGQTDQIILNLEVGPIKVSVGDGGYVMTQNQPEFGIIIEKQVVADVLQIDCDDIRDDYPIQWVSTGLPCIVVPLKDESATNKCAINHDRFRDFFKIADQCNLLVFSEEENNKLKVRVFMDDPGFLEDPATGSANGNLAGYLLKYDYFQKHEVHYTVSQGDNVGRPSRLDVNAARKDGIYQIEVGGNVFMVAEGTWS